MSRSISSIFRFVPVDLEDLRMDTGEDVAIIFDRFVVGVARGAGLREAAATETMASQTSEGRGFAKVILEKVLKNRHWTPCTSEGPHKTRVGCRRRWSSSGT